MTELWDILGENGNKTGQTVVRYRSPSRITVGSPNKLIQRTPFGVEPDS